MVMSLHGLFMLEIMYASEGLFPLRKKKTTKVVNLRGLFKPSWLILRNQEIRKNPCCSTRYHKDFMNVKPGFAIRRVSSFNSDANPYRAEYSQSLPY